ncbi:MAG TPA: hypothetical protein VHT91_21380 [Kofleriaceae bacterium]|nr:hypothetical protein [Kofleriaceae bacterium]
MIGRRITDAATSLSPGTRAMRRWGPGLVLALAACGGTDRAPTDASPAPPAPDAALVTCPSSGPVSFKTDVVPLIGHCTNGDGCHGIGRLTTWPYQALINVVAADCSDPRVIVKPGDPSASYLVDKLLGVNLCNGTRMPPPLATPLSDASMATIEAWICQGAANN